MDTEKCQQFEMPKSEVIYQMVEWIFQVDIFRSALELKVWEKVAAGEDTAERMASIEGWNPTGTRMLLDAICSLKLLTNKEIVIPWFQNPNITCFPISRPTKAACL